MAVSSFNQQVTHPTPAACEPPALASPDRDQRPCARRCDAPSAQRSALLGISASRAANLLPVAQQPPVLLLPAQLGKLLVVGVVGQQQQLFLVQQRLKRFEISVSKHTKIYLMPL